MVIITYIPLSLSNRYLDITIVVLVMVNIKYHLELQNKLIEYNV